MLLNYYKLQNKCQELMSKNGLKILALSGLISNISAPPLNLFPFLILCFVPLSIWLGNHENKQLMKGVIIFVFFRMIGGLYWIGLAPGTLLGPYGYLAGVFFCIIGAGVYFVQLYISYLPLVLFKNTASKHIAFIVLWSFSNWCFEYIYIPNLPWQNPAIDIAFFNSLANSSAVLGIHGLGLAVSIFVISVVYAITSKSHIKPLILATAVFSTVLVSGIWNLQQEKVPSKSLNVTIVQPDLPINAYDGSMSTKDQVYKLLSLSKSYDSPDLILWSETILPFSGLTKNFYRQIQDYLGNKSFLILGHSEKVIDSNNSQKLYNSLLVINKQGELVGKYRKNHLVPFGEYTPFRKQISYLEKVFPNISPLTQLFSNYSFGESPKLIRLDSFPDIVPVICFEIVFPIDFIEDVTSSNIRPKLIVNITEDGWFGYSLAPFYHLANVKMRAIEQGLPVVRSANSGVSVAYDAFGRELGYLGLYESGAINVDVPIDSRGATPFSKWHNTPYAVFLLITLLFAFLYRRIE